VPPIKRLLHDLEIAQQEALIIYKIKYEQRLSWERARNKVAEEHNIGSRAFWKLNNELVATAIKYLDISVLPETQPETQPEMVLENPKSP
jgi:hypothetical protein